DSSAHRLTLDGMSKYNTNDAAPDWVDYAGSQKFRLHMPAGFGDIALGESDHVKSSYTTVRGFEVTGSGARIIFGGNYTTLEYVWSKDITTVGATIAFDSAVTPYPECKDIGRNHDITLRNITIERGIGEGMYIAGTYLYPGDGSGCPAYGN